MVHGGDIRHIVLWRELFWPVDTLACATFLNPKCTGPQLVVLRHYSVSSSPRSPIENDPIERIYSYLQEHIALNTRQKELIRKLTRIERYPKGAVLLAQGQVARESWLVINGCVRMVRGEVGDEQTIAFFTELQPAIPPTYGTENPSSVMFECLEDVVASATTREEEENGFSAYPELESVCRVMGETMFARLSQTHIEQRTLSPEARYKELVARRPDLLQRVPQYLIASYLGIQPETLSRIRRRLIRRKLEGRLI